MLAVDDEKGSPTSAGDSSDADVAAPVHDGNPGAVLVTQAEVAPDSAAAPALEADAMIPPPMDVSEDVSPAVVERVTHIELGGYTFNADFDSGNLARIEQRSEAEAAKRWKDHQLSSSPQPDFRSPSSAGTWRSIANAATQRTARPPPLFTLWTRADCEGTPHALQ